MGTSPAFAETENYAHAVVITAADKEISVEVADTVEKRSLGLGKRQGLKKGWGMLFIFENKKLQSFWMKDMQFPLDIIWLDDYKIIHILQNVQPVAPGEKPPILKPSVPANFVLELNAGRAAELKLQLGQRLKYKF
ncbi:MAG: DUF192 domain-containing protein [SAR324 cluster bacterium]|nr:DUF192 domain-containing protein [SAR324 cluster bacterium]